MVQLEAGASAAACEEDPLELRDRASCRGRGSRRRCWRRREEIGEEFEGGRKGWSKGSRREGSHVAAREKENGVIESVQQFDR